MTGTCTKKTLAFCQAHDWGEYAYLKDGVIYGLEDVAVDASKPMSDPDRIIHGFRSFDTPRAIRDWAGY